MDLHKVGARADWEMVTPTERTALQRLAARSRGWVTIGNALSFAGMAVVAVGAVVMAEGHTAAGIAIVGAGRLADVFDGMAAQATQTKSGIGEAVDAGCDKLAAAGVLAVLLFKGLLPMLAATLIIIQNAANIAISMWSKGRGRTVHPNRSGKLAAIFEWAAICGFTLAHATHASMAWNALGYLTLAAFTVFGYAATAKYALFAFVSKQRQALQEAAPSQPKS